MNRILKMALMVILVISVAACGANSNNESSNVADSTASDKVSMATDSTNGAWVSLFDGKSLGGWHGYNKTKPVSKWEVQEGGILACIGKGNKEDLVSDQAFGNFELEWEWKIAKGGNSGIMYHVVEDTKYKAAQETGPEYQLIDDIGFPEKLKDWQKTGANYGMKPADESKKELKPVGAWNTSKIVYNNGHVEHWLNGKKIVEFQEGTDAWKKEKAEGKWKDYPDYKIANHGKIVLQDHGDSVWFRNIRIKAL